MLQEKRMNLSDKKARQEGNKGAKVKASLALCLRI